jgi:hypothetical protein
MSKRPEGVGGVMAPAGERHVKSTGQTPPCVPTVLDLVVRMDLQHLTTRRIGRVTGAEIGPRTGSSLLLKSSPQVSGVASALKRVG